MFPGAADPRALALKARPLHRVVLNGRKFLRDRPLVAKAIPTAVGFAFGDVLTQLMNRPADRKGWRYKYRQTVTMGLVGAAIAAPIGLAFLRWMDVTIFPSAPNSIVTLSIKFLLDQVLGCALWQCSYLSINEAYREAAVALLSSAQVQWNGQTEGLRRRLAAL